MAQRMVRTSQGKCWPNKIAAGRYMLGTNYLVEQTPDGWRWTTTDNKHGGEWRAYMHEACADCLAYMYQGA